MRELRRRNDELEKEKIEGEKKNEDLQVTVDQLRCKLTQVTQVFSVAKYCS